MRPVLIVEKLPELKRMVEQAHDDVGAHTTRANVWDIALSRGYLEYLSAPMIDNLPLKRIASTYEELYANLDVFSHVEVIPSVIMGLSAGLVRFPQHNPSPRNIFQVNDNVTCPWRWQLMLFIL